MQLLQPLAIQHVGRAARHVLHLPRIDQLDLEAALGQQLEQRNPVDPGGFHDHGVNAALLQPIGQPAQLAGERGKAAHVLPRGVPPGRYGDPVFLGPDIDAGRVQIDARQLRRQRHFQLRRRPRLAPALAASRSVRHGVPLSSERCAGRRRGRGGAYVAFSQTGPRGRSRVTTVVAAPLRDHANSRASSTIDGSVSSTRCACSTLSRAPHSRQVTSRCIVAPRRTAANSRLDPTAFGGGSAAGSLGL